MQTQMPQADVNHNIKYNTLNGVFAVLAMNLVMPFIAILALKLDATNFQMGLISSLPPAVALIAMLPGAFFVERFSSKKAVTGVLILLHRFFFVLLALTPLLSAHQVWFLVIVNGLMNLPGSVAGVAWQSFVAGAIPAQQRARAFTYRNRLVSLFGMGITMLAGQIFRLLPQAQDTLYTVFFIIAFGFALFEVWFHFQMRETVVVQSDLTRPCFKEVAAGLLKAKPYLVFCGCSLLFHFGWQMAWPLFSIHQVRNLGATESWIAIISVVNGGMAFLSYGMWRRLVEKKGNQFALIFATLGISTSPFLYAMSTSLYHLVAVNGLIGVALAGIILVLFNSLLDVVPDDGRTIYIAVYTMLINFSATIAPMVGIGLLEGAGIIIALSVAGTVRLLGTGAFALRYLKYRGTEADSHTPV